MRRTIAVLIDHVDHLKGGYETQLRAGFNSACTALDLNLLIVTGRALGEAPYDRIYSHVRPGFVDGVVLVSSALGALTGAQGLVPLVEALSGIPLVSLGLPLPGVPSIVSDNRPGMRAAIEHLIAHHGRKRVAFLGGPETNVDAACRYQVYREVLSSNGLEYDPALVESGSFTRGFGSQSMQRLIDRGTVIDAVVAANDGIALGALQVARARGYRVPRDLSLVGFDDLELARHANPALTTVRQPLERMAQAAIESLVTQLAGREVPAVTDFPVELVRRSSCGCDFGLAPSLSAGRTPLEESPLAFLESHSAHLLEVLAEVIHAPRVHALDCVSGVVHGLRAELAGDRGAFVAAVDDAAATAGDRVEIYDELQSVISVLRAEFAGAAELEDVWHSARRAIAAAHGADQSRRRVAIEASYFRLLASGERLATAFDWPSLKAALSVELPEVAESAFISLYADDEERELRPFFCLRDRKPFDPGVLRYPATQLLPPRVLQEQRRSTWFVLPLTWEMENLGVVVFDAGSGIGAREMLRKQIASALKSVALHREILQKTTLHERSTQERLATAERLSSLSMLAGGVAHDLNNTLGPLVALPDVILNELDEIRAGGDDAELRSDMLTIKTAALRASQTIKDLLALGRQGRTSREAVDLNQLVQSCVSAELRSGERFRPQIELELSTEPLVIRASEAQVARALSNLIRNAVEAVAGTGRVIVSTSAVSLDRPLAAYENIEPGDYAVVRVEDGGRGIESQDLGRIFEPFFTKKRTSEHSGSGLGLSIVHGVIKEHDGFVDVVSELGHGTEFALYFRRSLEPLMMRRDSRPATPRGSARILVIDDDPVQLRTARRVLCRFGYEVVTTRSGAQAEALCDGAPQTGRRARPFDLLIVDMLLNERDDGLSLFERIEQRLPGQRGILVSGHAPSERVKVATQKGLSWLAKPYGSDELARAVQAALAPRLALLPPAADSVAADSPPRAAGGLALARRSSERP